jgi:hypothetical protein
VRLSAAFLALNGHPPGPAHNPDEVVAVAGGRHDSVAGIAATLFKFFL